MKKRILALVCATVMTFAMSLSVCAASSPNGSSNSGTPSVEAESTVPDSVTNYIANTENVPTESLAIGNQQLDGFTINQFAAETKVLAAPATAVIEPVAGEVAAAAVAQAKAVAGNNAMIATVVDISVPSGATGTFTLSVPAVKAGQNVVVLHGLGDGKWETIKPSKIADGEVTFAMTSYSPVAVVVNATAGKTGDVVTAVAAMAIAGLTGAVALGKKKSN